MEALGMRSSVVPASGFSPLHPASVEGCGTCSVSLRNVFRGSRFRPAPVLFADQSHLQFYTSVVCGKKDKLKLASDRVFRKASGSDFNAVDERLVKDSVIKVDEISSHRRAQKEKMKLKKCDAERRSVGSTSSSSSESESPIEVGARSERIRREWEILSRSALLNSLPTFSSNFRLDDAALRPSGASFNSPTSSSSAALSSALAEASKLSSNLTLTPSREFLEFQLSRSGRVPDSLDSSSHSLSTLAGLAIVRDVSEVESQVALQRVEVCMGGKCKKNGSQEILSAFQAGLPSGDVTACKCLKNCKAAVNVRIQKSENCVPQVHSTVRVEDVEVLLGSLHYSPRGREQKYFASV